MRTLRTYQVKVIGCKVNQYEAQQISEFLCGLGLRPVATGESPDLAVVHGCAVTSRATAKSRRAVRRCLRQGKGPVVVSGCAAQLAAKELAELSKAVTVISEARDIASVLYSIVAKQGAPNSSWATINQGSTTRGRHKECMITQPGTIAANVSNPIKPLFNDIQAYRGGQVKSKIEAQLPPRKANNWTEKAGLGPINRFWAHKRAFVKVQDGCDGFCSYCLIPQLRRSPSWRRPEEVVKEVRQLVENGYREVVLAGVHLGAYGRRTAVRIHWDRKQAVSLAELLGEVAAIGGLERVRLSSLEPGEISEELLEVMRANENIAKHLHLPLQSGSQRILSRMNRQYTVREFLETVERARSRCGSMAVSSDVIVGFPGETDEDFRASMNVARQVGFVRTHVFDFSARAGTAAAAMSGQVPRRIRQERSRQMRRLGEDLARQQQEGLIGQQLRVLVEGKAGADGLQGGLCEQYFRVAFERREDLTGQMVSVLLEEVDQSGARGSLSAVGQRVSPVSEKMKV